MRKRYLGLSIVTALVVLVALGQILSGQAPAPGGQGAPAGAGGGQAPGGGGRGGAGGGRGAGGRGGAPAAPAGPIVRSADGKPDFTGYWSGATKTNINNGRGQIVNPETG